MNSSRETTISGTYASLTFEARGRLVRLYNKKTRTELPCCAQLLTAGPLKALRAGQVHRPLYLATR